jgi:glycosyltransferase involved in cell wall biosynthesis
MSDIIGNGGLTFILNDSNDLAEKIMILLRDQEKLKNLSENALIRVRKYEWVKIVKDFINYAKNIRQI